MWVVPVPISPSDAVPPPRTPWLALVPPRPMAPALRRAPVLHTNLLDPQSLVDRCGFHEQVGGSERDGKGR